MTNQNNCPITPNELRGMAEIIHNQSLKDLANWIEDLGERNLVNVTRIRDAWMRLAGFTDKEIALQGMPNNADAEITELEAAIYNQKQQSPWVSVSERLPTEDGEWRLCKTNRNGKCVVAKFESGGWIASIVNGFMGIPDEVITHFRDEPLPESEDE